MIIKSFSMNDLRKIAVARSPLGLLYERLPLPGLANHNLFTDFSASETHLYVFSLL
jgi:hypothetical protein